MVEPASPLAMLGGIPLAAHQTIEWPLVSGPQPHYEEYLVNKINADDFRAKVGQEVDLIIKRGSVEDKYTGLIILDILPAESPLLKKVLVTDRRWRWQRILLFARYNVRRRTGERRRVSAEDVPFEIAQIVDDVAFAEWSIDGGTTAFTAAQVMEDILSRVITKEGRSPEDDLILPEEFPRNIPIEDHYITDQGPEAILRTLNFISGLDLFITRENKVKVFDTLDGSEKDVIIESGLEHVGEGYADLATFAFSRPSKVRVHFQREVEVRFNVLAEGESLLKGDRVMENVIEVPDPELTLADGTVVVEGTYIPVATILAAWNADAANRIPGAPDLTEDFIQRAWCWEGLWSVFTRLGQIEQDPTWPRRVAAVRRDYRQLYRIRKEWTSRIYSMRAYRVSVLDVETGTKGKAQAFMDYCWRTSQKGKRLIGPKVPRSNSALGVNVLGYNDLLSLAQPAPVDVVVVDEEQGVIRLVLRGDKIGFNVGLYPGFVQDLPVADISDDVNDPTSWDYVDDENQVEPRLRSSHRVAIVLTVAQGAPNTTEQLHVEEITATETQPFFKRRVLPSNGPVWDIFIAPQIMTAWFGWLDSAAFEVEKLFGVRSPAGVNVTAEDADVEELLLNKAHLRNVALSAAARLYASLVDRYIGNKAVSLKNNIEPTGSIRSVTASLTPAGVIRTKIALNPDPKAEELFAFMPDSTRALVRREVQP